ncbi:hypothetical protein MHU86_3756 [Fragilaria crotonensis]|nr:hypothetical protein MHU86_3756 [Fragilaria crotonensis]
MTILKLATALFSIGPSSRRYHEPTTVCHVIPMTCTTVEKSKYEDLLEWMRSKDAEVSDKLIIQQSTLGDGYGAFVTSQVDEGEILFTVPRQACVTLSDATTDPKCGESFSKIMEKAGPGGNTVVMAAYLAKEYLISMEQEVKFGPYLETLPWERGINSQEHVLFWTDAELDANLGGSFCYAEAKELRSEVALATKVISKIVGDSIRIARGEMDDGFRWPWQITPSESADGGWLGASRQGIVRRPVDSSVSRWGGR